MIKYNCTTINRNPEICIILESWPCNFPIFSQLPPDPSEHFPPSLFGFRLTSAVVVSACRKASQWQQTLALLENMEVAVPWFDGSEIPRGKPVEGKVVFPTHLTKGLSFIHPRWFSRRVFLNHQVVWCHFFLKQKEGHFVAFAWGITSFFWHNWDMWWKASWWIAWVFQALVSLFFALPHTSRAAETLFQ